MNKLIQVMTTTDSLEAANSLAATLVEDRLAACVQIVGPVTSVYRWKEKLETATEFQCVIKTRQSLWEPLRSRIESLHNYDEPEIIGKVIDYASDGYRQWVFDQTID